MDRQISICFRKITSEASTTQMDSLPDGVVEYILSKLSNAKDVASCNCVSKKWKDLMSYRKRLCFPHDIFDNLRHPQTADSIVMQMVSSVSQLKELVVSCRFTIAGLASWLLVAGSSLKNLELHVLDNNQWMPGYNKVYNECLTKLECIGAARNLRSLTLWHVLTTRTPKWDVFQKLRELEIHVALLEDSFLMEALRATPNLTRLVLGKCEGLSTICIELLELRYCQLDVYHVNGYSLTLRAPKIQYLEIEGCNRINILNTNCLKTLSIHSKGEIVTMVEFGDNLMALESLCVKGLRWRSDIITKILQLATQVKHLGVEIIFTRDGRESITFPEIDFVDFFKTHPKLKSLHITGGMIDALCNNHMTVLKNVDSSFVIPCLEEVIITAESSQPLIAENMSGVIEWLLKYGNKLNAITVNTHAIDFSKAMQRMFWGSTTVSCDS